MSKNYRFGIIGGGQLARMLVQAGQNLGFEMHVLSDSNEDPAALVTSHHHNFRLSDRIHLENFINHMTFVTFESEFIEPKTFDGFEKKQKLKFYPSLDNMAMFRDRKTQKKWLVENKIPTAKYISELEDTSNPQAFQQKLNKTFPHGFVLKKILFGYDGYGTWISTSKTPLESVNLKSPQEWIVEEKISFKRTCRTICQNIQRHCH